MNPIYIFGAGAVGLPLAAYLTHSGRKVIAVRTSRDDVPDSSLDIAIQNGSHSIHVQVEAVSLSRLGRIEGTMVIAVKNYANTSIARELARSGAAGPVVILQNGLGVEEPFRREERWPVFRCVLYMTSQREEDGAVSFRAIAPSPIGVITGEPSTLPNRVAELSTEAFPFRAEEKIGREVWKKAIINAVFNSICPLLEIDNGVFVRQAEVEALAAELVRECLVLTTRLEFDLTEEEIMCQISLISQCSTQLISTLQDIRHGRPTEIEQLNLEMARLGAAMEPKVALPRVELLGKLILAKSRLHGEF